MSKLENYIYGIYQPWFNSGKPDIDLLPPLLIEEVVRVSGLSAVAIIRILQDLKLEISGQVINFEVEAKNILPAAKVTVETVLGRNRKNPQLLKPKTFKRRQLLKYGLLDLEPDQRAVLRIKSIMRQARYFSRLRNGGPAQKIGFSKERFSNLIRETLPNRTRIYPIAKGLVKQEGKPELIFSWQKEQLKQSAQQAYDRFIELGPFYGSGQNHAPTFRVAAEAVVLPESIEQELWQTGEDLKQLASGLSALPAECKQKLDKALYEPLPIAFRIDAIYNEKSKLQINEIQISDGADALMTAEQQIYNGKILENLTPGYYLQALRDRLGNRPLSLILLRPKNDPYKPNSQRMAEMLARLSNDKINLKIIDIYEEKLDLKKYDCFFLSDPRVSPEILFNQGVKPEQLLWAGPWTALGNKLVIAFLFDQNLDDFWQQKLGRARLDRLRQICIPTTIISSLEELQQAKNNQRVVKVAWSDNPALTTDNQGVVGPWSDEAAWQKMLINYQKQAVLVEQPFIRPKQLSATLKKGQQSNKVNWYNRICSKYVVVDDMAFLTATEATLGPRVVPAGQGCCFTAVTFKN